MQVISTIALLAYRPSCQCNGEHGQDAGGTHKMGIGRVLVAPLVLALVATAFASSAGAVPASPNAQESALAKQRNQAERHYEEAKRARIEAHRKLAEAQTRLDRFLERSFASQLALSAFPMPEQPVPEQHEQPATTTPDSDYNQTATEPAKALINPDWLAMRRRLHYARNHREQLLVDRTPMHPTVRAADEEVADLERRLEAIPRELVPEPGDLSEELRQMTDPLPAPLGLIGPARDDVDSLDQPLGRFLPPGTQHREVEPRAETFGVAPRTHREDPSALTPATVPQAPPFIVGEQLNEFLDHRRELAALDQSYRRTVDAEREAWRQLADLPTVEIARAAPSAPPVHAASESTPPSRRATGALLIAMVGAAGVGMVVSGVSSGATFVNATQAAATLPVPVLGTLPAADAADRRSRRRRRVDATIKIAGGAVLLIVCLAILLSTIG